MAYSCPHHCLLPLCIGLEPFLLSCMYFPLSSRLPFFIGLLQNISLSPPRASYFPHAPIFLSFFFHVCLDRHGIIGNQKNCVRNQMLFLCQMATFIFLSCKSTRKSMCEKCTLFLPSTRVHDIIVTVFIVEIQRLIIVMRKYILSPKVDQTVIPCTELMKSSPHVKECSKRMISQC